MDSRSRVIIADENIPFVRELFGRFGEVRTLNGRSINAGELRDADVLLIRSVTPVDRELLVDSPVHFVGSTTIGTDHVDREYLQERGIVFAHAPGSNATSVVEYVLAALLLVAIRKGESLRGKTVGIVGTGNIGSRLAARLPALGVRVLKNDPPLAEAAGISHDFVSLETILAESDIVTLHVPLERKGRYPTYHLIDEAALSSMKRSAWLVNTCRGAVVDNSSLRRALGDGHLGAAILDVWEGEPEPDSELIRLVDVATPHIAGYSYDGKVLGAMMVYEAFLAQFAMQNDPHPGTVLDGAGEDLLELNVPDSALPETEWLHTMVRQMYDIEADDARMRAILERSRTEQGAYFTSLRKHYPKRRTFSRFRITAHVIPDPYRTEVRDGLNVQLR